MKTTQCPTCGSKLEMSGGMPDFPGENEICTMTFISLDAEKYNMMLEFIKRVAGEGAGCARHRVMAMELLDKLEEKKNGM